MVVPNGSRRGALRVDVDPLVVAGGLREQVDPLLVDLQPVGAAELLADGGPQFVRAEVKILGSAMSWSGPPALDRACAMHRRPSLCLSNLLSMVGRAGRCQRRPGPLRSE